MFPKHKIGCWVNSCGDQPAMSTSKHSQMESKFMAVIALTQKGVHYFEVSEKSVSLNSDRYVLFLTNLAQFLRNQTPPLLRDNLRLIHNARPHVSTITTDFLNEQCVTIVKQPPYSPITICAIGICFPDRRQY